MREIKNMLDVINHRQNVATENNYKLEDTVMSAQS